ncbi:MAG: hypothetical protein J6K31_11495 [Parabacteroides sp.]|nr:hypothetical protein [Parabacteroides sp.]
MATKTEDHPGEANKLPAERKRSSTRINFIAGFYTKKVSYRYKRTKLTEMVMQNSETVPT